MPCCGKRRLDHEENAETGKNKPDWTFGTTMPHGGTPPMSASQQVADFAPIPEMAISERGKTCHRMLRQMLLVHAWAGLTLRRRARKSLTQQNTMDLDRSEDLDWSMDGADPWDFC